MTTPKTQSRSFFYSLGAFSIRRKWIILVIWIAAIGVVGPQAAKLQDRMSQGGFEVAGSQSDNVRLALENDFESQFQFSDLLVFHSEEFSASDPEFKATVSKTLAAISKAPGVAHVADPYTQPERSISKDGRTVIASVNLSDSQDDVLDHNPALEEAVAKASTGSKVEALLTGAGPFYSEFTRTTTEDLERAEKIAFPLTLLILVVAFASLVAAGMPIILALISLGVAFGLISIVAANTTVSLFTQNIASMIGIGVGIDYSLFILTRYREELRAGRERVDAAAEAIATSGRAVFVSGLTVVVALSGTQLVNLPAFRSMGFGAMIAVAVAVLAALTLLPALLGLLGSKVNSLSFSRKIAMGETGGIWRRWAHFIMRRPVLPLIIALAVIVLLASPALELRLGSSGPSILPEDSHPRRALEFMAEGFGAGQVGPMAIVLTLPEDVREEGFDEVFSVASKIASDPEVAFVNSIATLAQGVPIERAKAALSSPEIAPVASSMISKDGKSTVLSVITKREAISEDVQSLVKEFREDLPEGLPAGAKLEVGGDPGLNYDINSEVTGALPSVVGLVLALSFVVLLLFLRSILLPLKAILMNTASVLAAYGLVVFIFQQGHFEDLLGFKSEGIVESFLPLFLFCILFGLSMDYEVFLLARIREEYLKTHDNTEAVGWGLEHTARIITSAAAVMVTVFGAFALARLLPIKAMGFGLAAAVFLDATVIRIVMVPATMRLMGRWNWWMPNWLDRLLPSISLEGSSARESPERAVVS
jgi:RND superfamily putative drug exporter